MIPFSRLAGTSNIPGSQCQPNRSSSFIFHFPALAHFVDTAAAKYAGDSRTNVAFERATTQPAAPRQ